MAKIRERCYEATGRTTFICDFSPPRTGEAEVMQQAAIDADFISVAYNPGRAVRVNSAMLAAAVKARAGKDVVFTLATRDMNRLALQSLLLGAQLLGLENVVVVRGDAFSERDLALLREAGDIQPTGLIAAIAAMNQGLDFRGSRLRAPTDFCVGGASDLGRGIREEARLARRKVRAGAQFFITQPIFDPLDAARFHDAYNAVGGEALSIPVFFGLQVLEKDGVLFSSVPERVRRELDRGRSGVDIALELFQSFRGKRLAQRLSYAAGQAGRRAELRCGSGGAGYCGDVVAFRKYLTLATGALVKAEGQGMAICCPVTVSAAGRGSRRFATVPTAPGPGCPAGPSPRPRRRGGRRRRPAPARSGCRRGAPRECRSSRWTRPHARSWCR